MLSVISEETVKTVMDEIFSGDMPAWRKKMIHYIKDENPELNTAIIEASNRSELDPKAIALGAYIAYSLIEVSEKDTGEVLNYTE